MQILDVKAMRSKLQIYNNDELLIFHSKNRYGSPGGLA
jgi:hypothetical protein